MTNTTAKTINRDDLADYIITANRYALTNYYAWITYDEASNTLMIAHAPESADVPYNRAYPNAVIIYRATPYTLRDIYGDVTSDGVDTSTDEFKTWYLYDGLEADQLASDCIERYQQSPTSIN